MREFRVRNQIPSAEVEATMKGRILTDDEYSVLIGDGGPVKVFKPDGTPLLVYLPRAIPQAMIDDSYAILHELRKYETDNRGPASGYVRGEKKYKDDPVKRAQQEKIKAETGYGSTKYQPRTQEHTEPVASAIIGAWDPYGAANYCRLTAWSGKEWDKFEALFPLFRVISDAFKEHVPERYGLQEKFATKVDEAWRIKGTVFTTITVNNSYSTGVHQDAGDLREGFGNLAVIRKGNYRGGRLCFPEFGVAADMKDGDILLMDVHSWHGNTQLICNHCNEPMHGLHDHDNPNDLGRLTERISIVAYARARMDRCGTVEEELEKARVLADKGTERGARYI